MNSELNKLFGRDFTIGFLLPALLFLVITAWCSSSAGRQISWLKFSGNEPFKEGATWVIVGFVLAIFLQAINRELFRSLEGYWPLWIRRRLEKYEQKRFLTLQREIAKLNNERDNHKKLHGDNAHFPKIGELIKLSERAATRFPADIHSVLPTSFGNTARAYEDYPRVMYGFESIGGWARIQTVISKQAADLLSKSRGRVDLWLNLFFLSWAMILESMWLALHWKKAELLFFALGGILFAAVAYCRARSSAERYGDQVKSTYDVYLGNLCEQLGYRLSVNPELNRQFWFEYSQAFVYRDPRGLLGIFRLGLERAKPKKVTESDSGGDQDD